MQKGLRQGDSVGPFLFLLVVEGLGGMMRATLEKSLIAGCKIGNREVHLSSLQFADDALFMGQPNTQNVITLKAILRCFELVVGLKVNFYKSKLVGIGVTKLYIQSFASMLNC